MKNESGSDQPRERSSLALAGEWGLTIAVSTTLCSLIGYWLGMQTHNQMLTVGFVLVGIAGGFALAVGRMLKVTDQYLNAGSSPTQPASSIPTNPANPANSAAAPDKPPSSMNSASSSTKATKTDSRPNYFTSEDELDNWDAND